MTGAVRGGTRNDLEIYQREATSFWDESSPALRSLRSVGEFHLGLIEREWGPLLRGARVVDLGCGGGRMALALAERGALVTGVDRAGRALEAGLEEARRRGLDVRFVCADLTRTPLPDGDFDFVVLGDVLEHLEDPRAAIAEAARLLAPRGRLFVNTFDRRALSTLAVVHLAEGLGLVPRGTHDPRMFVRPAELEEYAAAHGLAVDGIVWERPRLGRTVRTWTIHLAESRRRSFGYSAFLRAISA